MNYNKLIIDAGHGGTDSGAVNGDIQEKYITLNISYALRALMLQENVVAGMTRISDVTTTLEQRVARANIQNYETFVSIHCNAHKNKSVTGIEVYTSPGKTKADIFAAEVLKKMKEIFPDHKFREDYSDGDPDKEAKFNVLTGTKMPAILIECEFMSNDRQCGFLLDAYNQYKIATAIQLGYNNYLISGL